MSNFKGTKGPWEIHPRAVAAVVGANRMLVANCGGHADNSRDSGDLIAEQEANARLIAEAGTVLHETGLTPRQLAEQRAELLARLEALTAACEEEFCGEGTEAIEPDDSKVAFPEDECHITFGMIRSARAAIANATQQRNATGAAS